MTTFTFGRCLSAALVLALPALPALPAPARDTAARAAAVPVAAASAASAAADGNDPLERLHQRLSQRLGSVRQPTDDGSMLLKVPARQAAAAAPARSGASSPRRAPRPKAVAAHGEPAHWDYGATAGPAAWSRLTPEFDTCASGTRQSPIDIRDGIAVDLDPLEFDYRPTAFSVIDNGHTVQATLDGGNTLSVGGSRYDLLQFHFHRPSEERINGRGFEMVVHLVHRDERGRLAVLAVLLEQGRAQPVVQQVWNNLPLEKGLAERARLPIDLQQLLPEDRRYVTYMGSLTTPPCTEGVLWLVMKQPVQLAAEQIGVFSRLYPMNARPVQPAHGRMVKEGR